MYAIVEGSVCKYVTDGSHFTVNNVSYTKDTIPENRKELGIYDFVHIPMDTPDGYKCLGTIRTVDPVQGVVTESWQYQIITEEDRLAEQKRQNSIHNEQVKEKILALERGQDRCIREAIASGDNTRAVALESSIAALRATLIQE